MNEQAILHTPSPQPSDALLFYTVKDWSYFNILSDFFFFFGTNLESWYFNVIELTEAKNVQTFLIRYLSILNFGVCFPPKQALNSH